MERLLRPKSIAIIGGGKWCASVAQQCRKIGFDGPVWPVHPKAAEIGGFTAFRTLQDLPSAPDACFIGVNRNITIDVVRDLSDMGAGGVVCFASGFSEATAEDAGGQDLQARLIKAAGQMPLLGPNCYGFINYLDGALLWPDQHGGRRVDNGVAIVVQSSNIAINMTMQNRSLPVSYIVTAGNQAQKSLADIGGALLDDDRVTVLGLHIEGFKNLRAFEALSAKAHALGKPIVALKIGKSQQAKAATISHTASLAGSDAGAGALLERLGIARVGDLPTFLETLKLLHCVGPLPSARIATMSCSGGEASLAADIATDYKVQFPALNQRQGDELRAALGPMVALANPLDYHTYIWRDTRAMARTFAAMIDPQLDMTLIIADYPRADRCNASDWGPLTDAVILAKQQTGGNLGLVATLPELLPEAISDRLIAAGVVPMLGLREAIAACEVALARPVSDTQPLLLPTPDVIPDLISEAGSKRRLAEHGLRIPKAKRCTLENVAAAATEIGFPIAVKGEGLAHKTEAGAVALNVTSARAAEHLAKDMPTSTFLIEEMVTGTVAELLIGVVKDPAHGFVLTLAAGGTLTELLEDSTSMLVPASKAMIEAGLSRLKINRMLCGYRGAPAADHAAIVKAIRAVQAYVVSNAVGLQEIEVNPLLCTPTRAVAVDALIHRKDTPDG